MDVTKNTAVITYAPDGNYLVSFSHADLSIGELPDLLDQISIWANKLEEDATNYEPLWYDSLPLSQQKSIEIMWERTVIIDRASSGNYFVLFEDGGLEFDDITDVLNEVSGWSKECQLPPLVEVD